MRWPRQFRPRRFRQKRTRKEALLPLLRAVEKEAPPEGLLLKIEQALDDTTAKPTTSRRTLLGAGATASAVLTGAWLFLPVQRHRASLIDQSGRPIVQLVTQNGVTTAEMIVTPVSGEANMSWHLWGLPESGTSIHLGALLDGGLVVDDANQFARFAVSLERARFLGDQPVGPVVELSAQKN